MATATGLKIRGGVTPNMLPMTILFSPTVVIAAGRVDKLGADIRSFHEPLLRSVREVMVPSIRENFNTGGRPGWEPLSEATLEVRSNYKNPNTDPLVWTGTLRRVASQINIWTITKYSAMVVDLPEKVWYGKIHQAGYGGSGTSKKVATLKKLGVGKAGGIGGSQGFAHFEKGGGSRSISEIPARPFIMLQPEDVEAIHEVFINWLGERAKKAWP